MAGLQQLSSAQYGGSPNPLGPTGTGNFDWTSQGWQPSATQASTFDPNNPHSVDWSKFGVQPTASQNTTGSDGVAPGSLMAMAQGQNSQPIYNQFSAMPTQTAMTPNQMPNQVGFNALSPADQQQALTAQRVAQASGTTQIGQGHQLQSLAAGYAGAMSPFDQYRQTYAQQLQQLMTNPSSITQLPGYQAGIQGIESSAATKGLLHSGNVLNALKDYSGSVFDQQVGRLSGLAGAGAAPGAGGMVGLQGAMAGSGMVNSGVGTLGLGQLAMNPSQSTTNLSNMWEQFAQQMQGNMNNFR